MYEELDVKILSKDDPAVTVARSTIIEEIRSKGKGSDQHMIEWFIDRYWLRKDFAFCHVIYLNGSFVSLAGSMLEPDNTMKILCNFYVMKKYRVPYKSLHQIRIIPECVEYARKHGLKGIWYSFHGFDKRHQRYSESQKRFINGSGVDDMYTPYRKSFVYVGEITYRGVKQDKFYMDINSNLTSLTDNP